MLQIQETQHYPSLSSLYLSFQAYLLKKSIAQANDISLDIHPYQNKKNYLNSTYNKISTHLLPQSQQFTVTLY